MSILDLIFPKKCVNCKKFGDFLCPDCFSKIRYIEGVEFSVGSLDLAVSAVAYNGVAKKLIRHFKYKPHVSRLGEIISSVMNEGLAQNEALYAFVEKYKPIIMPVPLSNRRYRERGYNHAEIIGNYVAKYFGLQINSKILIRIKDTKPQYKLNKEERFGNIRNAFSIRESASWRTKVPKSALIIDDVATTYATLKEAAKVLKKSGVKNIMGVTFAREL